MWLKQGVDEIDAETAAAVAEADKSLEVSTDLAPVQRDLVRLGRIVSTHWVQSSSARPGDRLPIGPTDYFYDVIAQLTPGQVARLTGGRTMVPATLPPVQPAGAKPWDHPAPAPGIPANLAPFLPSGASWVRNEELDRSLVGASGAHL
ncbi:hypothetical protein [Kitasatospora camelliae]|uniref:hypothetical protein n=1 Tax=Kitasatospora camelliae TaxID=3156397 RepID=UPI00339CFBD2